MTADVTAALHSDPRHLKQLYRRAYGLVRTYEQLKTARGRYEVEDCRRALVQLAMLERYYPTITTAAAATYASR